MIKTGIKSGITVYDPLVQEIRSSIEAGKLQAGEMIGTERDMVRQTGLSRVSIRRAVGQLVKDGLVERRVGKGVYVREPHGITRMVEILVPDLSRDPWVRIVRSAQAVGLQHGIRVQIHDGHQYGDLNLTFKTLEKLPEIAPDGAILGTIPHPNFAELIYKLKSKDYPFVVLGAPLEGLRVPFVASDNHAGFHAVGQELVRLGHRRIAFIGPMVDNVAKRRCEGLRDGVNDAGIAFDRFLIRDLELVNPLVSWRESIERCMRDVLALPDPPTALCFPTDGAAADAYQILQAMGLRVPDDISVVGHDDEPICEYLNPTLTSVAQPMEEMGQTAMDVLLKRMRNPRLEPGKHILPVRMIRRNSIGPVPTKK